MDMDGRTFKEILAAHLPDDAEVAHLWDGGFSWRKGGILHAYSLLAPRSVPAQRDNNNKKETL